MVSLPYAGIEEYTRYWSALGKFMHLFTELEGEIKVLLSTAAGARPGMIQAVWSGTRADAAVSLIKRIRESDGSPADPLFVRWAAQFAVVNKARNDIIHNETSFDGAQLVLSNYAKALPRGRFEMPVSAETLDDMSADVLTISVGVVSTLYSYAEGRQPPEPWIAKAGAAWRYIPPIRTQGGNSDKAIPSLN